MVGHSKIDHTMDLYTHVQLEMKREAMAALDQMYNGPSSGKTIKTKTE